MSRYFEDHAPGLETAELAMAYAAVADPYFFSQTGHYLSGRFREYWGGALPIFGYPISEEFDQKLEDGKVYRVQYFERARFEYHPENAAPYDVLLGQFGRLVLQR